MSVREAPPAPDPGASPAPPGAPPVVPAPAARAVAAAAVAAGLASCALILARLFVGGVIGMGDQGDGRRLMCQLGVRTSAPFNANPAAYLYPRWIAHHWYGEACTADAAGGVYRSTELWLLSLAKHLTPALGFRGTLDLRALGVICAVLVGLVVGALVVVLPGSIRLRIIVASLVGLLAADAAVAQFFVSPYSEPVELIGALALCPALIALWRKGHTTWGGIALVVFVSTAVIGAKTQAAALLPALLLALLWLPHGPGPFRAGRAAALVARIPALVACVVLLGATAFFVRAEPTGLTQQNIYLEVFGEILVHSSNRPADLRSLGADPSLASATGTNPESPAAATLRPQYLAFTRNVTEASIVRFYVGHPVRLFAVGADGLRGVAQWRQDYLGSYPPGSGHRAGAIEDRVGFYGLLLQHQAEPILVLLWILTLYLGVRAVRSPRLGPAERAIGRLAVFTAVAAFCEFWAVMISAGYPDVYRHMILTNVLFALGVPLVVAMTGVRFRAARQDPLSPLSSVIGPKTG